METFVETKSYHPSKARINDKTFKKIKLDEYYTTMDDDRVRWSLISEIPFYVQSLVFAVKNACVKVCCHFEKEMMWDWELYVFVNFCIYFLL